MSSRGAMITNGHVMANEYKAIREFGNVKVLVGIKGKHSLPDYTKTPNRIYVKLDHNGNFKELRDYDKNGKAFLEIAYHAEEKLTGNRHDKVLHYHIIGDDLSHKPAQKMSEDVYVKYKDILEVFGI